MQRNPDLIGLLLAGGASSRMGVDKASLEIDGEPLARRVTDLLSGACDSILVASGDGERLAWLGLPQVADIEPDAGPLGGLIAGLEAATTPLMAVVAVDMPDASAAVFDLLARRAPGHDAAVPRTGRGLEPLHAVYAAAASRILRRAFDDGERSVTRALARLDVVVVEPDEWAPADPSGRFARNLNRPSDLGPGSA
ncbi:MAG TPA: molybdenum cofactor guanylyltransferase [Actinomycetota bacterium]